MPASATFGCMPRRQLTHRAPVGAALAFAVALAGCAASPEPEPTPTKTAAAPIFASDEEALAAAEEAFHRYLEVGDQIANEGGVEPERLRGVASGREEAETLDFFERLRKNGTRLEGKTAFDSMKFQELYQADGIVKVSVYFCMDVSGTKLISAAGEDITQQDRKLRVARTAVLVGQEADSSRLLVDETEKWPGDDFC